MAAWISIAQLGNDPWTSKLGKWLQQQHLAFSMHSMKLSMNASQIVNIIVAKPVPMYVLVVKIVYQVLLSVHLNVCTNQNDACMILL